MKRLAPAVFAIVITLILASCGKKEYTCSCKVTIGGVASLEETSLGKISNNAAQKKCNAHQLAKAEEYKGSGKVVQCHVIE